MEKTAALFDGENAVKQIHARGLASGNEKDANEFVSEDREVYLDALTLYN